MNSSERLSARFVNELAIIFAQSMNCNLWHVSFVIFTLFLSILLTSLSIETVKAIHFSVVSPKQVNCFINFSANSFVIKW